MLGRGYFIFRHFTSQTTGGSVVFLTGCKAQHFQIPGYLFIYFTIYFLRKTVRAEEGFAQLLCAGTKAGRPQCPQLELPFKGHALEVVPGARSLPGFGLLES